MSDGEALVDDMAHNRPSSITYASKKAAGSIEEDRIISTLDLGVRREDIDVVKAEELFE